ncbi:MAG: sigma-70 family RNA polymerase sigma factor [Polyangiaceae bacterium]
MSLSITMPSDLSPSKRFLAEPAMRRSIEDFVRRRVPASDVDDIVQTVLVEALASSSRPQDEEELRRWLLGIARHKVVDHHRRRTRETAAEIPDLPVGPAPVEERSLAQWAEKQAGATGDAKSTLEWMAREGEGEKLEAIAAEEKVPAARVRQRVSRMRRWMKERWLAELAAAAALAVIALVLWRIFRKEEPIATPGPEPKHSSISPEVPPLERAQNLRLQAFKDCDRGMWRECLDRFDEAKQLDPAGDADPKIGAARAKANDALQNEPQKTKSTNDQPTQIQQKNAPSPVQTAPAPRSSSAPTAPAPPPSAKPVAPKKPAPKKEDFTNDFAPTTKDVAPPTTKDAPRKLRMKK